jgi:hypothetical protein
MCERTYTGCPHCSAPAADNISFMESRSEEVAYSVADDGQPRFEEEAAYGDIETSETWFRCNSCGWTGPHLDDDCSEDECDCRECDPEAAIVEPSEPDSLVLLKRTDHNQKYDTSGLPEELKRLLGDRTLTAIPCRAERAGKLYEEHAHNLPVTVESVDDVPPNLIPLMIPEEEAA